MCNIIWCDGVFGFGNNVLFVCGWFEKVGEVFIVGVGFGDVELLMVKVYCLL